MTQKSKFRLFTKPSTLDSRNQSFMVTFLIIIHVVVCIALIMIVLLQTGKGADMGAIFGGGSSQTLFGSTGATTFLTKLTTGAAIIFMATSLIITYVSSHRTTKSVMIDLKAPSQTQTQRVDVTPKAKSLPEKKGVESSQEK